MYFTNFILTTIILSIFVMVFRCYNIYSYIFVINVFVYCLVHSVFPNLFQFRHFLLFSGISFRVTAHARFLPFSESIYVIRYCNVYFHCHVMPHRLFTSYSSVLSLSLWFQFYNLLTIYIYIRFVNREYGLSWVQHGIIVVLVFQIITVIIVS